MTPARLDAIIASLRANGSTAPVSPHDLVTGFLLLADIRDAERALRVAVTECVGPCCVNDSDGSPVDHAARILRAIGVDP